jgi:hypothetical protein
VQFRIPGPLEASNDDGPVALRGHTPSGHPQRAAHRPAACPNWQSYGPPPGLARQLKTMNNAQVTARRIIMWVVLAAALIAAIIVAVLLSGGGSGDAGTGY